MNSTQKTSRLVMKINTITATEVASRKLTPPSPSILSTFQLLTSPPSYRDVVIRLEPIIMELERSEDILIVTHQAVIRCIYAYFMKKSQEESPWMAVPLHTLIKLTPRAYGTEEVRYDAKIPAVSTWRGKGSVAKHEDPVEGTGVVVV